MFPWKRIDSLLDCDPPISKVSPPHCTVADRRQESQEDGTRGNTERTGTRNLRSCHEGKQESQRFRKHLESQDQKRGHQKLQKPQYIRGPVGLQAGPCFLAVRGVTDCYNIRPHWRAQCRSPSNCCTGHSSNQITVHNVFDKHCKTQYAPQSAPRKGGPWTVCCERSRRRWTG